MPADHLNCRAIQQNVCKSLHKKYDPGGNYTLGPRKSLSRIFKGILSASPITKASFKKGSGSFVLQDKEGKVKLGELAVKCLI